MKKITIPKADPSAGEIEGVVIEITGDMPDFSDMVDWREGAKRAKRYYIYTAKKLFDAIVNHVARGVVDQLLLMLLESRASLYRGAMEVDDD